MADITNPHDRFFAEVFSRTETARDFVRHYLPPEVVVHFDIDTLTPTKDSFIDPALRRTYSDLLFTVQCVTVQCHTLGLPGYLYLLFEHKSYPDPDVSYQVLRYTTRIWEQYRKGTPSGLLPPIFPVVFYHGKNHWKISPHFRDRVACPPEFEPYLPNFRYHLCDLSTLPDGDLRGTVLLQSALLLMKHIFHGAALREKLPAILGLMGDLAQKGTGLEYLETFLRYLVNATDAIDAGTLQEALTTALPGKGDTLMPTIAEKWFEDGRQQGVQQGVQQGIQQGIQRGQTEGESTLLRRQLERKFGPLPATCRSRIAAADSQTLLRWGERILTALTLDEVFED